MESSTSQDDVPDVHLDSPEAEQLVALHADLARKYAAYGSKIESTWMSFSQSQRLRYAKAAAKNEELLSYHRSSRLDPRALEDEQGVLNFFAKSNVDTLLKTLRHRAQKSLFHQFCFGIDGLTRFGDHDTVVQGFDEGHPEISPHCRYMFLDVDKLQSQLGTPDNPVQYASRYAAGTTPNPFEELSKKPSSGIVILSHRLGHLIIWRQFYHILLVSAVVDTLLGETRRNVRQKVDQSMATKTPTSDSLSLCPRAPPRNFSVADLHAVVQIEASESQQRLDLFISMPHLLCSFVQYQYCKRPDVLPDEKGRRPNLHNERHMSYAVFDSVHDFIQKTAIWNYLKHLVEAVEQSVSEKLYRSFLLQEVANVCQLEYEYCHGAVKGDIQVGAGRHYVQRLSSVSNGDGTDRVALKIKPESVMRKDVQLYYLLSLCQPKTTPAQSLELLEKLIDLYDSHPRERDRLDMHEDIALSRLNMISVLIRELSRLMPMPPASQKKGRTFVTRWRELGAELLELRQKVDLSEFAVPTDNLMFAGQAEGALNELARFVTEKTGSNLVALYKDLIEDSLSSLREQHQHAKDAVQQSKASNWQPLPSPAPEPLNLRVEKRREKEKTRPTQPSAYTIHQEEEADEEADEELTLAGQTFQVSASTAQVFSTLFCKTMPRGSIAWTTFEAAMAELEFSILPKGGSIFTFFPPESMNVQKSLTLHRPHKSHIEGTYLFTYAQRLARVYGWGEGTFQTAA